MEHAFQVLLEYKYLVFFAAVLAEQLGLPFPALPFLLAAGAFAAAGQIDLRLVLLLGVIASVASDVLWYRIGRSKGGRVLNLLCRISLEPDSCVRKTEVLFARHGARSLVVAKFVPGFNTAAPPMAGAFGMRFPRFLMFDTLGAILWVGAFVALGYGFSDQLEAILDQATRLGGGFGVLVAGGFGGYVLIKYVQRRRFLRQLRIARISPAELHAKLEAGEDVVVVDLRHSMEFEADPASVPGALRMPVEEVAQREGELPREKDIVLLCT